jgi:uroporphyrinogen-III synthase
VADELRGRKVQVDLMPESSFFMKPLVRELVKALGAPGVEGSDTD